MHLHGTRALQVCEEGEKKNIVCHLVNRELEFLVSLICVYRCIGTLAKDRIRGTGGVCGDIRLCGSVTHVLYTPLQGIALILGIDNLLHQLN